MSEKSNFGRALEEFEKRAKIEKEIFKDSEKRRHEEVEEIEKSVESAEKDEDEAQQNIGVYHTGNEDLTKTDRTIKKNKGNYEEGEADTDQGKVKEAAGDQLEKFKEPIDKTDDISCKVGELKKEAGDIEGYKEVLEENLQDIIKAADEEIEYINKLQEELETDDPCYAYDKISQFLAMEKDTVENMKNNVEQVNQARDQTGDFDLIKQYSQEIEDWSDEVKGDIKRICNSNEFAELTLKGMGLRRKYGRTDGKYDFDDEEILKDYNLGDVEEVESNKDDLKTKIANAINQGESSPEYVVGEFKKELSLRHKGDEKTEEEKKELKKKYNSILKSVTEDVGLDKMITGLPGSSKHVYDLDTHTKELEDEMNDHSKEEIIEEVVGAYEHELRKGREGRDSVGEYLSRPFSAALGNVLEEEGYSEGLEEVFDEYC